MDETVFVHIKGQVSFNSICYASRRAFWQPVATQGCAACTSNLYEASAPVLEILQDFCDHFGLSSAACKLFTGVPMGHKEVPKNKLLGQVLVATKLLSQPLR